MPTGRDGLKVWKTTPASFKEDLETMKLTGEEPRELVVTIPRWRKLVAQCPNRHVRKGLPIQRNGIF